ncbi:hypothetical protein [Rhodobacter sp. NSM]|uniref:hypothetical protein n=1 Tax=Rhodobacter sp. NSM TaxID=3457501 RepID=UPI003FD5AE78
MRRPPRYPALLLAVSTIALAASATKVTAQPSDIVGVVEFEGGAAIPEGEIDITLDGPASSGHSRQGAAGTRVTSDGKVKSMDFSVSAPAAKGATGNAQLVARLERKDGWLLARGSAPLAADGPVKITLYKVMY